MKEKLLFDPSAQGGTAKRVLVSERPEDFRPAVGRMGEKILELLSAGPKYPAQIARTIGAHHQTVYYHMGRLEKAGLVSRIGNEVIRGGEAHRFSLTSDGYAVEFHVKGEKVPNVSATSRSKSFGRFFREFMPNGELDAWIVVGSPMAHGEGGTQARDGHYAVQLGFALGQFVKLPSKFPVKLDVDIKAEKLKGSNLIVVGGPRTNVIAEELNSHMPIKFREGGFWGSIVDETGRRYESELDCIVAKVENPWNHEGTCVVAAGLTGAGTKAAIIGLCNESEKVLHRYAEGDFACVLRGIDKDGDGKVDSVETLRRQ